MTATQSDSAREVALARLELFCSRILPGTLHRISIWKGLPRTALNEWLDDLRQELAIDCLANTAEILRLSEHARHGRWMRAAERTIYRLRRRERGYDAIVDEPRSPLGYGASWPAVAMPRLVTLNNGRTNVVGSMRQNGQCRRELRRELDLLAAQLGWDDERHAFWQTRVAEALTGMAADLMRQRRQLVLLDEPQASPDPRRRLRRLRQLARRFPVQPSTLEVRRALRPWQCSNALAVATPRRLLEQAVCLRPGAFAGWLWLFEACCVGRDAIAASRALIKARRCESCPRAATVLARARLLELRGRLPAGVNLLQRAARRWPGEAALLMALSAARSGLSTTTGRPGP